MLVGRCAVEIRRRSVENNTDINTPIHEMASTGESATAIPACPRDDDHWSLCLVTDVPGQRPPGVFHELQQLESEFVDGDPVDFPHLVGRHCWYRYPVDSHKGRF
jgi:hypothetical protein